MPRFRARFTLVSLLLCSVIGTSLFAAERQILRMGLAGTPEAVERSFGAILAHLETSEDYRFEITTYSNYDVLYAAFKAAEIDLALVGSVKYAEARHETGAIPIIAEGGMVRSMIVVKLDSPIKTVRDLQGKAFGMGYEGSTSTHLIPLLLLSKNRLEKDSLGSIEFLGTNQDDIVEAIVSGNVDAAGIVEPVFDRFRDKVRAIETSDPFPGAPLITHKGADPKLIETIRKLFLSYKPVEDQRFAGGAIAVTDADFNQIRFLCKIVLGKSYL